MTGSRLAKAKKYTDDKSFMLTYGDGVADIDLKELLKFHKKNNGIGTFTSVIPEGRFGVFRKDSSNLVTSFSEKKDNEKKEINAGFFVFENEIFNYLNTDDSCVLEEEINKNKLNYRSTDVDVNGGIRINEKNKIYFSKDN